MLGRHTNTLTLQVRCLNLCLDVSHLKPNKDGSIQLVVDRRLFSRSMVKRAAATVIELCHVHLDLDEQGAVIATFSAHPKGSAAKVRTAAGHFGNLLVSYLATSKLDAQARTVRNLVVARALDGALPRGGEPPDCVPSEDQ